MELEAEKTSTTTVAEHDDAIQNEESPLLQKKEDSPLPSSNPNPGSGSPPPEVEIHLFRRGRGPAAVFRSRLGGWSQDQLEVGEILEAHGLKSLFAFDAATRTRGVAIRFHPRNGRSLLPYNPGAVVFVDGEPKDSLVKPVTKVLVGVAAMSLVIAVVLKEIKMPEWLKSSRLGKVSFPPWVLACVVIVFTRLRKRTRDVMKKFGW